jgi:hypothetical protein
MSPLLDDADERIRSTLRNLPVGDDGPATVLPAVRAGARSRRNRRRTGAATGVAVAFGLAVVSVVGGTADTAVVTATAPPAPTTSDREYHPLTSLADGPLPVVEITTLVEHDGFAYSVESEPGRFTVNENGPSNGVGLTVDPETTSALLLSDGAASSTDPDRPRRLFGVTRADVASVDWVVPTGTLSTETFGHPVLPDLRFFFLEDPEQIMRGGESPGDELHVIAYADDGAVLADSRKIDDYESAHPDEIEERSAEVDRRRGVEVEAAAIARFSVENATLTVDAYRCEGDPVVDWIEDATVVRLSVTVKRPIAEGACLSGETQSLSIVLGSEDRPIIDALTGQVLVEAGGAR